MFYLDWRFTLIASIAPALFAVVLHTHKGPEEHTPAQGGCSRFGWSYRANSDRRQEES